MTSFIRPTANFYWLLYGYLLSDWASQLGSCFKYKLSA